MNLKRDLVKYVRDKAKSKYLRINGTARNLVKT